MADKVLPQVNVDQANVPVLQDAKLVPIAQYYFDVITGQWLPSNGSSGGGDATSAFQVIEISRLSAILAALTGNLATTDVSGLVPEPHDRVLRAYPDASPGVEVYEYKLGGLHICYVTVTYFDSTKEEFISAIRS